MPVNPQLLSAFGQQAQSPAQAAAQRFGPQQSGAQGGGNPAVPSGPGLIPPPQPRFAVPNPNAYGFGPEQVLINGGAAGQSPGFPLTGFQQPQGGGEGAQAQQPPQGQGQPPQQGGGPGVGLGGGGFGAGGGIGLPAANSGGNGSGETNQDRADRIARMGGTRRLDSSGNVIQSGPNGSALTPLHLPRQQADPVRNPNDLAPPPPEPPAKSRVICTELVRQGRMTRRERYWGTVFVRDHISPLAFEGYHAWAIPVVRVMRRNDRLGRAVSWLAEKTFGPRAREIMSYYGQAEPDAWGWCVRKLIEPFSWCVGLAVRASRRRPDPSRLYDRSYPEV